MVCDQIGLTGSLWASISGRRVMMVERHVEPGRFDGRAENGRFTEETEMKQQAVRTGSPPR